MCVYDNVVGWNTLPYLGQVSFTWNMEMLLYEIEAPANHIVVGSGELLLNPEEVLTEKQLQRWKAAKESDKTVMLRSVAEVTETVEQATKKYKTYLEIQMLKYKRCSMGLVKSSLFGMLQGSIYLTAKITCHVGLSC